AFRRAHIRLDADVDLAGAAYGGSASSPLPWECLGDMAAWFKGVLDGNGHGIANLRIDAPSGIDDWGLVGCASGAAVRNLSVSGSVTGGRQRIGVIVGRAEDGTSIEGCSVSGRVAGGNSIG